MSNGEIIGQVIIGLSAIVGLFIAVGKPIINLNNNIVKLTIEISSMKDNQKALEKIQEKQSVDNTESHRRLFDMILKHDDRIDKNEKDILELRKGG